MNLKTLLSKTPVSQHSDSVNISYGATLRSGKVSLVAVHDGQFIRSFGPSGATSVAISPSSVVVASYNDGVTRLFKPDGALIRSIAQGYKVNNVSFSGEDIVCTTFDGKTYLFGQNGQLKRSL